MKKQKVKKSSNINRDTNLYTVVAVPLFVSCAASERLIEQTREHFFPSARSHATRILPTQLTSRKRTASSLDLRQAILGDTGRANRDYAIFSGESLPQEREVHLLFFFGQSARRNSNTSGTG